MEICVLSLSGTTLRYAVIGTGKTPLIMLPGLSLVSVLNSAEAVAQAYEAFCTDYTIYLPDVPDPLPDPCTVEALAETVAQALAALGVRKAAVFGVSMGGMIAQCLAQEHPELVGKLVLASSLSRQNPVSRRVLWGWHKLAAAGNKAALNRSFLHRVYAPQTQALFLSRMPDPEQQGTQEDLRRFTALVQAAARFDRYEALPRITCPVLVLGSRQDRALSVTGSEELAQALGCEVYLYEEYSHAVYDEAPDFKERLLRFFAD